MSTTLAELAGALRDGRTSSSALVEACLDRITATAGEGQRVFLDVAADAARATAAATDALRQAGSEPSPYAGIPISIKDLFDIRGQVTRAGSVAIDGPPAIRDAAAVERLRRAGLILIGRTNMTEFAFSGLGINPHYGTPANPWDRTRSRIPGGSSSGAAVSLTDCMAHGALGTDTGGSCRIPAALCGVVGFKPTQGRIPRDGLVPLSPALDSVGVLGRSVGCCAILDGLIAGEEPRLPSGLVRPPRVAVVRNYLLEGLDEHVAGAFSRIASRIADAGAEVLDIDLPPLDRLSAMNAGGGFPAAEAYAWHRELIGQRGDSYDPRVLVRILRGKDQSAADLIALQEQRAQLITDVRERLRGFDAFICPTVPVIAPPMDTLESDDEYARINLLMLRNPTVVNLLDGCAASVPMHLDGEPPCGLMVSGFAGQDTAVLQIANWIEELR